jgi:hypothetical protein
MDKGNTVTDRKDILSQHMTIQIEKILKTETVRLRYLPEYALRFKHVI